MSENKTFHESFDRGHTVAAGNERAFGFVFAGVFAALGGLSWWLTGSVWIWALAFAVAFASVAMVCPDLLLPLNRAWFRLGMRLHRVSNSIFLGFLFFAAVVPTALLARAFGARLLTLRPDRKTTSYWEDVSSPERWTRSMDDPF